MNHLNPVEQLLKNKDGYASVKVLKRELNLNKKQVRRFIMHSKYIKPIEPSLCGSGKVFIPVYKYHEYSDKMEYYKRLMQHSQLIKAKKKNLDEIIEQVIIEKIEEPPSEWVVMP
jgi:hypothetical protein